MMCGAGLVQSVWTLLGINAEGLTAMASARTSTPTLGKSRAIWKDKQVNGTLYRLNIALTAQTIARMLGKTSAC